MAHFAQLDENNVVINVIAVSNNNILDENGQENEALGIAFCKNLLGQDTKWVQTSYNANFRQYYAGIGFTYNEEKDYFVPYKPIDPYYDFIYDEIKNEWILKAKDPQLNEILEQL
jgi:hypothetical protein